MSEQAKPGARHTTRSIAEELEREERRLAARAREKRKRATPMQLPRPCPRCGAEDPQRYVNGECAPCRRRTAREKYQQRRDDEREHVHRPVGGVPRSGIKPAHVVGHGVPWVPEVLTPRAPEKPQPLRASPEELARLNAWGVWGSD